MRLAGNGLKPAARAVPSIPPIGLALLLSLLLHAVLLFGVRFKMPDWKKSSDLGSTLEVVLVNSKTASRPNRADALAQSNLDGGGNTEADRRAKSPLPVLDRDTAEADAASKAEQVKHLEQQARSLLTQVRSNAKVETPAQSAQNTAKSLPLPDAAELVKKSLDMARLEGQISRDWDNYQKMPRRKFIGARTQEYRFAQYVEDWRIKVERVGNLNYPEAARQQKLYGSLQLTVSIRADGSLDSVEINRSSGSPTLDAAAVRIVRMAAPYAKFPEDIRKDTDVIGITRTWTFTHADQLATGQ